mmetsp:Transcript_33463/g.96678  ORF Transcript_33463/g.96678 Transcript_33463/m.96678 type:complete len:93 (+) Transcript_33463:733-1011(+)
MPMEPTSTRSCGGHTERRMGVCFWRQEVMMGWSTYGDTCRPLTQEQQQQQQSDFQYLCTQAVAQRACVTDMTATVYRLPYRTALSGWMCQMF